MRAWGSVLLLSVGCYQHHVVEVSEDASLPAVEDSSAEIDSSAPEMDAVVEPPQQYFELVATEEARLAELVTCSDRTFVSGFVAVSLSNDCEELGPVRWEYDSEARTVTLRPMIWVDRGRPCVDDVRERRASFTLFGLHEPGRWTLIGPSGMELDVIRPSSSEPRECPNPGCALPEHVEQIDTCRAATCTPNDNGLASCEPEGLPRECDQDRDCAKGHRCADSSCEWRRYGWNDLDSTHCATHSDCDELNLDCVLNEYGRALCGLRCTGRDCACPWGTYLDWQIGLCFPTYE